MDDTLRGLERAVEADPADGAAVRRYEQALRRADAGERLVARYRLKYACPLRFEDLNEGSAPDTRDCQRCQRPVRLARDLDGLAEAVGAGACVAFPRRWLDQAILRLAEDPQVDSAREVAAPCVVSSAVAWVDLSRGSQARASIEPGLPGLFFSEGLHSWPAIPLEIRAGVLHLAAGRLEPPGELLDYLRLASGVREIQVWLADPEQVFELLEIHAPLETMLMGVVAPDDVVPGPGALGEEGPRLA